MDLDNNIIATLFPEKRYYFIQNIYTTKAAIYSNLLMDIYIMMDDGNIENGWYTRFYSSPFMPYIWFSAILLIISSIWNLYDSSKKTYKIKFT